MWTLAPGADRVEAIETPEPPLTLETMDDQLFVGTDSGVFLWDDSAWSLVDDRPAYGLASHQGQLLAANAADGLFVAGEEGSTPLDGPARPGSMVAVGDALFFVDEVGGSLWSLPSVP